MTKQQPKTFYIRTYGCQMNELDSEIMVGLLEKRGLTRVSEEDNADMLIFNTCSIRDLAERKVMGKLGQLGRSKKQEKIIGVTGCMAMAKKSGLFRKMPHVDFVIGTNNIHEFDAVLDEVISTGNKTIRTDPQFEHEIDYLAAKRDDPVKAYVSIIRGCDKFCTYCVVPYTRGQEASRHPEQIEDECRRLVHKGYKEITLLGQNVNSYGKDKLEWGHLFHDLLYRLDKIEGLERIRFMTSHPHDITEELMFAVRDLSSLCEFVHFPIQSGSNRILKKMHRVYTREEYLKTVYRFREIVPQIALGTDIIVGFPTETNEEFQETVSVLQEIEYSVGFLFAYSPRKGTPAMRWKDDIPEDVKEARLQHLIGLQNEICSKQREAMIDTDVEILVEQSSQKNEGLLQGRTRCWKNVLFPGEITLIGSLQKVHIHGFKHQTLLAESPHKKNPLALVSA